jgi:hypothetical protein
MARHSVLLIMLAALTVILAANLLFHFVFFSDLHKNLKPASQAEREKVIEILNRSVDLASSQVKIGNVYTRSDSEIVQVELIRGISRRHIVIDLKEEKVVRG